MSKRVIGGTVFTTLVLSSALFGFFNIVAYLFLIVGIYEGFKLFMIKKDIIALVYTFLFMFGVLALVEINNFSYFLIMIIMGTIMLNDAFAYYWGMKYGKTKFSTISPNKSIEGMIGGIVTAFIGMCFFLWIGYTFITDFITLNLGVFPLLLMVLITIVFAIIGDLLESKVKRTVGVKDSGTIVYGHGGIMDRLDSWVLAAIPVYFLLDIL